MEKIKETPHCQDWCLVSPGVDTLGQQELVDSAHSEAGKAGEEGREEK